MRALFSYVYCFQNGLSTLEEWPNRRCMQRGSKMLPSPWPYGMRRVLKRTERQQLQWLHYIITNIPTQKTEMIQKVMPSYAATKPHWYSVRFSSHPWAYSCRPVAIKTWASISCLQSLGSCHYRLLHLPNTLIRWIPGVIHALFVILTTKRPFIDSNRPTQSNA